MPLGDSPKTPTSVEGVVSTTFSEVTSRSPASDAGIAPSSETFRSPSFCLTLQQEPGFPGLFNVNEHVLKHFNNLPLVPEWLSDDFRTLSEVDTYPPIATEVEEECESTAVFQGRHRETYVDWNDIPVCEHTDVPDEWNFRKNSNTKHARARIEERGDLVKQFKMPRASKIGRYLVDRALGSDHPFPSYNHKYDWVCTEDEYLFVCYHMYRLGWFHASDTDLTRMLTHADKGRFIFKNNRKAKLPFTPYVGDPGQSNQFFLKNWPKMHDQFEWCKNIWDIRAKVRKNSEKSIPTGEFQTLTEALSWPFRRTYQVARLTVNVAAGNTEDMIHTECVNRFGVIMGGLIAKMVNTKNRLKTADTGLIVPRLLDALLVTMAACCLGVLGFTTIKVLGAILGYLVPTFDNTAVLVIAEREAVKYADRKAQDKHHKADGSFQAASLPAFFTAMVSVLATALTGTKVSGAAEITKEIFRNFGSFGNVWELLFGHLETVVGWIAYKIDPECGLASTYATSSRFHEINNSVTERASEPKIMEKLTLDHEYRDKVVSDHDWLNANYAKLMAMKELARYKPAISATLAMAKTQWQKAMISEGATAPRPQPVAILLQGAPGVGKSQAVEIICRLIHARMRHHKVAGWDFEWSEGMIYTKPSTSQYFAGYSNQPFVLLDDWLQFSDQETIGKDVANIIDLVNVAPAPLDMAGVDEKGTVFFRSPVIICTTNFEEYKTLKMANVAALSRRFSGAYEVTRLADLPTGEIDKALLEWAWSFKPLKHLGSYLMGVPHTPGPHYKYGKDTSVFGVADSMCTALVAGVYSPTLTKNVHSDVYSEFAKGGPVVPQPTASWIDDFVAAKPDPLPPQEPEATVPNQPATCDLIEESSSSDEGAGVWPKREKRRDNEIVAQLQMFNNFIAKVSAPQMAGLKVIDPVRTLDMCDKISFKPTGQYEMYNYFLGFSWNTLIPATACITPLYGNAGFMTRKLPDDGDAFASNFLNVCPRTWGLDYTPAKIMTATEYITHLYDAFGPSLSVALWDYTFQAIGTRAKTLGISADPIAVLGIFGQYINWHGNCSKDVKPVHGIGEYISPFPNNSLPACFKRRVNLYLYTGCDMTMTGVGVLGGLVAAASAVIIASLVSAFPTTKSMFQSDDKAKRAYIGGDPYKGAYGGRKGRARRLDERAQSGSVRDVEFSEVAYTRQRGGDLMKPNPVKNGKYTRHRKQYMTGDLQSGKVSVPVKVMRNYRAVRFHFRDGSYMDTNGVFMDNRQFFFTWHATGYTQSPVTRIIMYPDTPDEDTKACLVADEREFSVRRLCAGRDMGVVTFRRAPQNEIRSLWKTVPQGSKFVPTSCTGNIHRYLQITTSDKVVVFAEGPYTYEPVRNSSITFRCELAEGEVYYDSHLSYYLVHRGGGEPGDCGVPYFAEREEKPFKGLHGARLNADSVIVPIFQEDNIFFEDQEPATAEMQAMPRGFSDLVSYEVGKEYPRIAGTIVIGEVKNPNHVTGFSKLYPVLPKQVQEHFERDGGCENYEMKLPSPISRSGLRNRNVATHNHGAKVVDSTIVDSDFVASFCTLKRRSKMYSFETALFGDPSRNISSAATTSNYVGWRYTKTKKELVDFEKKTYSEEFKKDVYAYLEQARHGPIAPVAQQFPKDELLDPVKVAKNLPRIIYGHDLAYNVALRMIFGGLVDDFVKHHSLTRTAMGVNPNSIDWATVMGKTHQHPNIMCTDIGKQEASVGLVFARAFAVFCKRQIEIDPEEEVLIDNLCAGLSSYYFISEGVVYLTTLGHSSGHFLTTLYNSFSVWCGLKLAFEELCPNETFEEHVSPCSTGDDAVTGVSDHVAARYNTTTCCKVFRDRWGIVLTDATKSTEPKPFVTLNSPEHTFLGRSFTKDKSGKIIGRLRMSSIDGMLVWTKDVKGMSKKDVIQLRASMAFQELANYTPNTYESKRAQYFKDCQANHVEPPIVPPYSEMKRLVHDNWMRSDRHINYAPVPGAVLTH